MLLGLVTNKQQFDVLQCVNRSYMSYFYTQKVSYSVFVSLIRCALSSGVVDIIIS